MKLPISDFRFPISDFRFLISDFRFPISDFRFSDFRFPIFLFLILNSSFFILNSCCRSYPPQQQTQNTAEIARLKSEVLLRVNRELVEEDAQKIGAYAESRNWDMKTTESGLWYMIYSNGTGERASTGKTVTLEYTLSLMDSTVCYSSAIYGQKTFILGFGEEESGLQEGVLLMREGDKARMIMPPHLAHGLIGDGDCIPRRAIIIYDVELVGLR